jgi:hypothetical protein
MHGVGPEKSLLVELLVRPFLVLAAVETNLRWQKSDVFTTGVVDCSRWLGEQDGLTTTGKFNSSNGRAQRASDLKSASDS